MKGHVIDCDRWFALWWDFDMCYWEWLGVHISGRAVSWQCSFADWLLQPAHVSKLSWVGLPQGHGETQKDIGYNTRILFSHD